MIRQQKFLSFQKLLFLGVFLELLIFVFFITTKEDWGTIFRYAARYSGRLSFIVYLYCFWLFVSSYKKNNIHLSVKSVAMIFAVLHLIHFIFLALSVYLNQLPIIPVKIIGGFLAYVLIIGYPFVIERIQKLVFHLCYFYYVGFVMGMTFLARIKGEFVGASAEAFHFIGLGLILFAFIVFSYQISKKA